MVVSSLPKIVILYGPAGCGKGTQGQALKQKLPGYYHLDFGTELRKFVKANLNSSDPELAHKAKQIKEEMNAGMPVQTPLLRFVVEKSIVDNVDRGLLIEGPGRKIEEASWLANFFRDKKVSSLIIHFHLELDKILERLKTRWYLPSNSKSYPSLDLAQKDQTSPQDKPYQREDDVDVNLVEQRYKTMYSEVFGEILKIYLTISDTEIIPINANQKVDKVSQDILEILKAKFS
jgi:adenylate kinase family enzyme